MKRTILIILGVLISIYCYSEPIDSQTAIKVALNYINYRQPDKIHTVNEVIPESNVNGTFYYIVTFKEGGWVMVSGDNLVLPILGYSFEEIISSSTPKPDAFVAWTDNYKSQITTAKSLKTTSTEVSEQWDRVVNNNFPSSKDYNYSQGTWLLDTPRGRIAWGQDENNSGGCSPSYNSKAPDKDENSIDCFGTAADCDCGHKPVGCAAVAMAQIMWYWQFPQSSSFRSYDWNAMPTAIYSSTPQNQADAIAQLLRDCGDAANTNFCCSGSWTTTNNIVDAFEDNFKYKGVEKKKRSDWTEGSWKKMLRAEIDAGRPILYRGDECDLCSSKHFFVVDGYRMNPDEFHINWGWWGYYNGFYTISDLTPGSSNFNKNNQVIIGISPTCNEIPLDITDLSYSSINSGVTKHLQARNSISIPSSEESLTVNNGGKLILTSGDNIKLTAGFSSLNGSELSTNISTLGFGETGIYVSKWTAAFTPNGDGINEELCLNIYNADSWELVVFDRNGRQIFIGAGSVNNNFACIWNGSGAPVTDSYHCIVRLRNSCGELLTHAYAVTLLYGSKQIIDEFSALPPDNAYALSIINKNENIFSIYPNPTSQIFSIKLNEENLDYYVVVTDITGKTIYSSLFSDNTMTIDLGTTTKGMYLVKVFNEKNTYISKLIIE